MLLLIFGCNFTENNFIGLSLGKIQLNHVFKVSQSTVKGMLVKTPNNWTFVSNRSACMKG